MNLPALAAREQLPERSLARHAGWVTATLLWLAGAYVLYYWLTAIRLL